MRHLSPLLVALCAAASPCISSQSQPALPSISGIVVDTQGSSIADAVVTLTSGAGTPAGKAASDGSGQFRFPALLPGTYSVSIAAKGFQTLTSTVIAAPGSSRSLTLVLKIAAAQTSVVVTATRSERSLADLPVSASVVTGEQIEQTPARTIDDLLRRVPSVDLPIASTNEQHPTDTIVSMRGLSGIRSLVLLDGVPLNDPFFGFVQWSEVPVETIDRVEVVRGGGSTLWGNYAMGGVINLITKPIRQPELVVESAGGTRGTYRTDGHAALAGERYGIGIDAGNSHTNGYTEQVADSRGPIDAPTSSTSDTVGLSGNVDLAQTLTASGRVSHYSNAQNFLTRLQTNGEGTWRYTGGVNWRPTDRQTVDLNLFHNDEKFSTNNTGAPDGADPTAVEYIQNIHRTLASDLGVSLLWSKSFTGVLQTVSAGGDYHGVHGSDAARIFDEINRYLRTDLGAGDQRFAGAFVQTELRPLQRLQLLFSLRYQDFYSYNGVDNTPGGLGGAVPTRHSSDVDPRLSARYQLPRGFALRGAVYRAFRAPTLDNLYRSASVPGYILYSNASLTPETLNGGEVGFDAVRGPVRFQATAYDSHVSHLLTYRYLDPAALPPGFSIGARLINAGSATSRGFEGELSWQVVPHVSTLLSYTYADSIVTSNAEDPASVGVQQPGIPKNRATLGVNWSTLHGIQVSPHLRYLSRTSGDPDNIFHTDPHFIADLACTVPVTSRVQAFVQIENLLSRTYVGTNDGFTAPLYGKPFTAVAGLRIALRSSKD